MTSIDKWRVTAPLVAAFILGACAPAMRTVTTERLPRATAAVDGLGALFSVPSLKGNGQSQIVVYRQADSRLPGVTSVFVEGRYHTSLMPGAWSYLCLRADSVELGVRQMQVGGRPKDLMDSITALSLKPGQIHYLRVDVMDKRPALQPVVRAQALQELVNSREQLHTISRAAVECGPAPAPRPAARTASAVLANGARDANSDSGVMGDRTTS